MSNLNPDGRQVYIKLSISALQYSLRIDQKLLCVIQLIKLYYSGLRRLVMRFGTFKSINFKKNWHVKDPVVPRSLML